MAVGTCGVLKADKFANLEFAINLAKLLGNF